MPIQSRQDYLHYLRADLYNSNVAKWTLREWLKNDLMRYQRILRALEYHLNCRHDIISRIWRVYLRWRRVRLGAKLGITISPNWFGPGLSIAHIGTLVVHDEARIGKNCRIHAGVNIGFHRGGSPRIGDNVFIGPGAKIFGPISIGSEAAIGANAVVNRDVPAGVTVGGVPARIISQQGARDLIPTLIKENSQPPGARIEGRDTSTD